MYYCCLLFANKNTIESGIARVLSAEILLACCSRVARPARAQTIAVEAKRRNLSVARNQMTPTNKRQSGLRFPTSNSHLEDVCVFCFRVRWIVFGGSLTADGIDTPLLLDGMATVAEIMDCLTNDQVYEKQIER